jgi:hypothetical protein
MLASSRIINLQRFYPPASLGAFRMSPFGALDHFVDDTTRCDNRGADDTEGDDPTG